MDREYCVLFISRRNSARSLIAEAVVNRHGKGRFRAFSAGVEPTHEADKATIELLEKCGYVTANLRPKHWSEFTHTDAPRLDFVFTLSDTASKDKFPEWPGKPASSHWRYPDPLKSIGDEWRQKREFARTLSALERQMRVFMQLPVERLDAIALQRRLDEIGSKQKTRTAEEDHSET
jgi:protein-tyrosine-phosphatase